MGISLSAVPLLQAVLLDRRLKLCSRGLLTPHDCCRSMSCLHLAVSGPQKGPAERGHFKKRQKSSKSAKNIFDTFRHVSRRAKKVKNRQKMSKIFSSTFFDNFCAAPIFRPLLGGSDAGQQPRPCDSQPPHFEIATSHLLRESQARHVEDFKLESSCAEAKHNKTGARLR